MSMLEKAELEERRRITERQREIRAEKELEDLRKLQKPEGTHSRLGWMYQDHKKSTAKTSTSDNNAYLSGRKAVTAEKLRSNEETHSNERRARDNKRKRSQDPMVMLLSKPKVSKSHVAKRGRPENMKRSEFNQNQKYRRDNI